MTGVRIEESDKVFAAEVRFPGSKNKVAQPYAMRRQPDRLLVPKKVYMQHTDDESICEVWACFVIRSRMKTKGKENIFFAQRSEVETRERKFLVYDAPIQKIWEDGVLASGNRDDQL